MNPLSKAFLLTRQSYVRSKLKNSVLLDVGSSVNPIAKNCITLDLKAHKRPLVCGSALFLPFRSGSVDSITFLEVIEHIPFRFQKQALREIRRVLKDRSQLLLSTPSMFPMWRLVWWMWENTIQKEYRHDHIGQLYPQELLNLLTVSGFAVQSFRRIMLFDFIVECVKN